ncbi:AAA family ATPase [Spirochaetota bacterium]
MIVLITQKRSIEMKLAVTGKGGVGKSTIASLIARIYRDTSYKVLVIDADPDMNLATILGIPDAESITPIVELKEVIAERTGTEVGKSAPIFKMNPEVNDIPDKYAVEHNNIKLMIMGSIKKGGGGCACPENAFLKQLISHITLQRKEVVILDMEAGIEHLGRGTAIGVDHMLVIVEPNMTSIETAHRIKALSGDIGLKSLKVIGNKTANEEDKKFIKNNIKNIEILGFLDYSDDVRMISSGRTDIYSVSGAPIDQLKYILEKLNSEVSNGKRS